MFTLQGQVSGKDVDFEQPLVDFIAVHNMILSSILGLLVCSIAEWFYELYRILTNPHGKYEYKKKTTLSLNQLELKFSGI